MSATFLFRNFTSFFKYTINLDKGSVSVLSEVTHLEVIDLLNHFIIMSYDVVGYQPKYDIFVKMPNCVNSYTLEMLIKLKLSDILPLMKHNECNKVSKLIKFIHLNKTWVTDGCNYTEYKQEFQDRVIISDKKSSFMFSDNSTKIHESLVPTFILFFKQSKDNNDTNKVVNISSKELKQYNTKPYYEVLYDLSLYYSWFVSQQDYPGKFFAAQITVLLCLTSNMKLTGNELMELGTLITNNIIMKDIVFTFSTSGIMVQYGGLFGKCTYYCPN